MSFWNRLKSENLSSIHLACFVAIVAASVLSRLIPHPPNFTPVAALALFAAVVFASRTVAMVAVFAAMLISDAFLGFHALMPVVYGSLAASVLIGSWLRGRLGIASVSAATLAGSVLFFVTTNFACWLQFYPPTASGLAACYTAAIPFFKYTVAGDAFYSAMLFGGLAIAQSKWLAQSGALTEASVAPANR